MNVISFEGIWSENKVHSDQIIKGDEKWSDRILSEGKTNDCLHQILMNPSNCCQNISLTTTNVIHS